MTVKDYFILNTPDSEGKVPVLIFGNESSGTDESLYLCLGDDEQWRIYDAKQSRWTDTQSNRDLFPLISEWLDEYFRKQIHESELDLSECYNEIFGQIQATGSPVDLKYSSLISVLRNTQWEREQEGLPTEEEYLDHDAPYLQPNTDVLIISDSLYFEGLSNLLWSKNITTQEVISLNEAVEFCKSENPLAILLDARNPMSIELSILQHLAEFPSKLVAVIAENDPNEDDITDLSDDTYLTPVDDKTLLHCLHRHLNPYYFSPSPTTTPTLTFNKVDVLLVYDPDASRSIQETFNDYQISSSVEISIPDAIAFCNHTTPAVILLDAKNFTKSHLTSLHLLQETKPTRTKLYSCLTENSPFQNEIIDLSDQIFVIPVRTSEIMKHVLIQI